MADKSTQLILDALTRAAADPQGLPLYSSKTAPGLFAATVAAKEAAQRCKANNYLRALRTEHHGKIPSEICALTEKGFEYLLRQNSPRQVLEDLVHALDARRTQWEALVAAVQQTQVSLEGFKANIETALRAANSNSEVRELHAAWSKQANSTADAATTLLAALAQWHKAGTTEDCPLPELFRRCRPTSIGHFHDALRRLHDEAQVYLHPWTGPLSELPEPAYALLVGHEVAYYASLRK